MKRVGKSQIGTQTFFDLPVVIELNAKPVAVLVPMPSTVADVQEISDQLMELVREQNEGES